MNMQQLVQAAALAVLCLVGLNACGDGDYDDPQVTNDGGGATQPPTNPSDADCDTAFRETVQPELDYCRTCHVPDGIGDVDDGRDFLLGSNADDDWWNLFDSWDRLGGNNPVSLILQMASGTADRSHTGGAPWPVGSNAYEGMRVVLEGFESGECAPPEAN